jgi:hypothetical protein
MGAAVFRIQRKSLLKRTGHVIHVTGGGSSYSCNPSTGRWRGWWRRSTKNAVNHVLLLGLTTTPAGTLPERRGRHGTARGRGYRSWRRLVRLPGWRPLLLHLTPSTRRLLVARRWRRRSAKASWTRRKRRPLLWAAAPTRRCERRRRGTPMKSTVAHHSSRSHHHTTATSSTSHHAATTVRRGSRVRRPASISIIESPVVLMLRGPVITPALMGPRWSVEPEAEPTSAVARPMTRRRTTSHGRAARWRALKH